MGGFILAAAQMNAQNTNLDFLVLNLNIDLKAYTNGIPGTNGNIASVKSGTDKINSKEIIQLLSGRRSFPLRKGFSGQGDAIFVRGAAVTSNFTSNAKLLIVQGLATNSESFFVVVRDGHPPVDYDVTEFFSFNRRGFESLSDTRVETVKLDLDTGETTSTRVYVEEFSFDDNGGADRVAFLVDGFTTEAKGPVKLKGVVIDPEATRSLLASVAGTGVISSNNFVVLKGNINAIGARHERK
jgi:hypothetical protein